LCVKITKAFHIPAPPHYTKNDMV